MPRRSRRIYVRVRTDPQSAQFWWPGLGVARLAGLSAAHLGQVGQTERRTYGRIAGSRHRLMSLYTAGDIITFSYRA